ncbi:MAG TPA: 16S rRNA (cytosine(1402)-N(4))-methyltransferase RsmH [Candidatus Cloacimonas sp.]|nr:rRNA (cytosine1402-N4)-methyltransferase [Candidatus Cloacimonadota bacterium]HCX72927.1 16S rRNA (cytosine(1402)-N(4))-methyltransferase RsmH [Candidatus Cloacimonas sp.]
MRQYHIPVMLKESVQALQLQPYGVYVDATAGGGGHTREILRSEPTVQVYAFDRDEEALAETKKNCNQYANRLHLIKDNFANLRTRLALEKVKLIDGILFDLGVSSHQIDSSERGFSFRMEGNLDMRMDASQTKTASDIVNKFPYEELVRIFRDYGEEREATNIAKAIVSYRLNKKIKTTEELADIIDKATYSRRKIKAKARIFQAIRIFLNRELESLETALKEAVDILKPGGRIAVISYHSLEDRLVKKFFKFEEKSCICPPNFPKCVCDKKSRLKILTKKPIIATQLEVESNSRARSAKLRIAEKKEL